MTGTWDSAPRPLNVSPPANGSSCGRPGGNFDDKGCQGIMVSLVKSLLQKEILIDIEIGVHGIKVLDLCLVYFDDCKS